MLEKHFLISSFPQNCDSPFMRPLSLEVRSLVGNFDTLVH
jgi:hypothetical protein